MTAIEFDQLVKDMPPYKVDMLLDALKRRLDPESYRIVAMHISLVLMYNDVEKYNAIKDAVGAVIIAELYGKK